MEKIACAHCKNLTIKPIQKFRAGKWLDVYCSDCGGRQTCFPIGLAILYFILVWDIFYFGFLTIFFFEWYWPTIGLVGWALLEFFIYYVPLVRLRGKTA